MKAATIRWAAESGITLIATANDSENTAMRRLNESLGYTPYATHVDFVRPVGS